MAITTKTSWAAETQRASRWSTTGAMVPPSPGVFNGLPLLFRLSRCDLVTFLFGPAYLPLSSAATTHGGLPRESVGQLVGLRGESDLVSSRLPLESFFLAPSTLLDLLLLNIVPSCSMQCATT